MKKTKVIFQDKAKDLSKKLKNKLNVRVLE